MNRLNILYVAPNINHHQVPFVLELIKIYGETNFRYAVMKTEESFRIRMGFRSYQNSQWLVEPSKSVEQMKKFRNYFHNYDVVICSVRSLHREIYARVIQKKLTFYFSERWWKPPYGRLRLLQPTLLQISKTFKSLDGNENFHYLAQGGYAHSDFRLLGNFTNQIWSFGYFTELSSRPLLKRGDKELKILWCGRLLSWKRVDVLLKAFKRLCETNSAATLEIVGEGPEKRKLLKYARLNIPSERVSFRSFLPVDKVREKMSHADIFVLPSNGYEGWGAVLNEAMSEGCCVIANEHAGAAKSIIENEVNGLIFKDGDVNGLYNKLADLANDEKFRDWIRNNGYNSIHSLWSPEIAAERFASLVTAIQTNTANNIVMKEGPLKRI